MHEDEDTGAHWLDIPAEAGVGVPGSLVSSHKVQNFEQFCRERGLTTTADVDSHIHAGLRSMPTTKTYARWNAKRLSELQDARDKAMGLYMDSVASGEVIEPPKRTLEEIADGLPELASTKAAKRLLEKRYLKTARTPKEQTK